VSRCRTTREPDANPWTGTVRARHTGGHINCLAEDATMNFIIWLIIGGIVGWLASMVMKTDAQQGVILNVVVGIVGALLGGWLISPLVGVGTINQDALSIPAILVSLVGAIILLAIVNLVRRGKAR
jgi:uncharacterized membrane protein YeaQ/YmgE (transglycosylase-associated protein family)